jgi:hypothetical protein
MSLPRSEIANLFWERMTEIYGHLWVSNYSSKPNKAWLDMLATLSTKEISYGIQLCKREVNMPNLPKFYGLCKSMPDPNRFAPALPAPKVDRAKVLHLLSKCDVFDEVKTLRKKAEQQARREEKTRELKRQLDNPDYLAEQAAKKAKIAEQIALHLAEQNAILGVDDG